MRLLWAIFFRMWNWKVEFQCSGYLEDRNYIISQCGLEDGNGTFTVIYEWFCSFIYLVMFFPPCMIKSRSKSESRISTCLQSWIWLQTMITEDSRLKDCWWCTVHWCCDGELLMRSKEEGFTIPNRFTLHKTMGYLMGIIESPLW